MLGLPRKGEPHGQGTMTEVSDGYEHVMNYNLRIQVKPGGNGGGDSIAEISASFIVESEECSRATNNAEESR